MKTRSQFPRFIFATLLLVVAAARVSHSATVTNTKDSGDGSLRQVIASAGSGDMIEFHLPAGSKITLTSGELLINKNLTIAGPGANLLTIQRSSAAGIPQFRIFNVTGNIDVTITGLTIANGKISGISFGGGILNASKLTLANSTISGNSASLGGGGISNSSGTLILTNSTVSGNSANSGGGLSGGDMTITNSTISGNTARSGSAGGIDVNDPTVVTVKITNSTIANNSASESGGGIFNSGFNGSTVRARNTIIALNKAPSGPDMIGSLTSDNFNLVGNSSGAIITPPPSTSYDQIGVTAAQLKLGILQDNGGRTKTHALLSGSRAIDKGDFSGAGTDQRGLVRPVDSPTLPNAGNANGSDIGAYEVQANSLAGCVSLVQNKNDSGPGSLRYVLANACEGSTITFAPNVRGSISLTSGELLIDRPLTINGPGPNLLTVQRSASAGNFRVFEIPGISGDFAVTIFGLKIANGRVSGGSGGGGIKIGDDARIANCIISGNSSDAGGGIYLNAVLTITDTTIAGNSCSDAGGGIYNSSGRMTITGSTLSGNSAVFGAGIYSITAGGESSATIINSTISGNPAENAGGGIFATGDQAFATEVTLGNSTISGNSAGGGGGGGVVRGPNATIRSHSTIIALNTAGSGPDVQGPLTSLGYNLIGDSTDAIITPSQSTDQIGVPAAKLKLGPLHDNGGLTQTRALLPGSVALDKGSTDYSIDQRGFDRTVDQLAIPNVTGGDGSDIGAFEAQAGLVGNVSTRLPVGTGDNALIEGFIVQGPAGSTKKIIVRAIGPSLKPFGVTDALANPTLEIKNASNVTVARNNDWKTTQTGGLISGSQVAEIKGSGVAPSNDLESAIIANLPPGSYTAVVRGTGNTTGTGVVDAYDLSPASPGRLVNFSTRGLIQPGDKLMIAGFIVQKDPVRAVVRAIGPSLKAFGIANALPDTTLQLRNQNGVIVRENDNWKSNQKAELEATGLQPTNDLEAALIQFLQPGQYTTQVRGKPETTGIGVVQVYFLQ